MPENSIFKTTYLVSMSIKKRLSELISKVLSVTGKNFVVGKQHATYPFTLFYQRSQHVTFFLKPTITYDHHIQQRLQKYIRRGDTVFDIGSNIGQYTLLFSHLVGTEGKVVAFEPDPKNFSFVQFNANMNRGSNIVVEQKGVSNISRRQSFYRDSTTGGRRGSFIQEFVGESFTGEIEEVDTISFEQAVLQFGRPDFVKIDVEGFEQEIICGIKIELNNTIFLVEVRDETGPSIFTYFNSRHYHCFCIDSVEDVLIGALHELPSFGNLLFIPASFHSAAFS
jgi:FkbM family methyltransferase